MNKVINFFNIIYNLIFRVITFLAMFYLISSVLFYIVPYSFITQSNHAIMLTFVVLTGLSFRMTKLVTLLVLQLQK